MACKDCEARRKLAREALFKAKVAEAAGHVAKGAMEAAGIKKKTGAADLKRAAPPKKRTEKPKPSGFAGIQPAVGKSEQEKDNG